MQRFSAEGLNLFGVSDLQDLTPEALATADIIVLTVPTVTKEISDLIEAWVSAGGTLIVITPEGALPFRGTRLVERAIWSDIRNQSGSQSAPPDVVRRGMLTGRRQREQGVRLWTASMQSEYRGEPCRRVRRRC